MHNILSAESGEDQDPRVPLNVYASRFAKRPSKIIETSLAELVELLSKSNAVSAKDEAPLFSVAAYADADAENCRKTANILGVHGVVGDIDDEFDQARFDAGIAKLCARDITFVAYRTYNSTSERPRWRIVVLCTERIDTSSYTLCWAGLNEIFGGTLDSNAKDAARLSYLPSHPSDTIPEPAIFHIGCSTGLASFLREHASMAAIGVGTSIAKVIPIEAALRSGAARAGVEIFGPADTNDVVGSHASTTPSLSDVVSAVYSGAPPKDRATWLPLIWGIQDALGSAGYDIARAWSAQDAQKFDPAAFENDWNSFEPGREGGVTYLTLLHWARQNGWRSPSALADDYRGHSTSSGFKLKRSKGCFSRVHAPIWLLEGIAPAGEIHLIAGLPGIGKTTFVSAVAMVISGFGLAIGSDVCCKYPRRVIIVSEHTAQYERLFHGNCDKYNIDSASLEAQVILYDATRIRREHIGAELAHLAAEYTAQEPPLIVIDTASSLFELEDENSNAEVGAVVAEIKSHVMPTGASVWIIAHTTKPSGRNDPEVLPRGASAYIGDAHGTAAIFRDDGSPDSIFYKPNKLRHERTTEEIEVATAVHHVDATNEKGDKVVLALRLGVPRISTAADRASRALAAKAGEQATQAVLDQAKAKQVLDDLVKLHGAVVISGGGKSPHPPSELGPCHVLSRDGLAKAMAAGVTRAKTALDALRASGTHDAEQNGWRRWSAQ